MNGGTARLNSLVPRNARSTLCRRCYLRYDDKKSPLCEHVYCTKCFDKSIDGVTDEFVCFACQQEAKTGSSEHLTTQPTTDLPRTDDLFEHLAQGVTNIRSIRCNRFGKPQRIGATRGGDFVVVDIATKEILIINSDGTMNNYFKYLIDYCFTGGLLVTPNDDILLTLRNDTYNSVCFYSTSGAFAYSAFLGHCAEATGLAQKESANEILALDNKNGEICVIDTEKSIHRQKRLKESGHEDTPNVASLTSISVGIRGDIIIHDSVNNSVHVYDENYNFKHKFDTVAKGTPRGNDIAEQIEEKMSNDCSRISVDRNNCLFATGRNGGCVDVFSLDGEFVDTVVAFKKSVGSVQDLVCFGEDHLAVLLTGGAAKRGEIRVYSYTVPEQFRKGDHSQCCTLL